MIPQKTRARIALILSIGWVFLIPYTIQLLYFEGELIVSEVIAILAVAGAPVTLMAAFYYKTKDTDTGAED